MTYPFLTKEMTEKLLENGLPKNHEKDHLPVVKLFTPDANATWLLTEILPQDTDIAFGLCDLGMGFPELGYVDLSELAEIQGKLGLSVEPDTSFEAKYPLSIYTTAAGLKGRITDDPRVLQYVANIQKPNIKNSPKPN